MTAVPVAARALGFAGLIPFVAGALAVHGLLPMVDNPVTGYLILQAYGSAILAFMGGCFWGFAAQADRVAWVDYGLAVIPGLWAFGAAFAPDALVALVAGFVVLQLLDIVFRARGLGPDWWITLRLPLTAVVLICLALGAWA